MVDAQQGFWGLVGQRSLPSAAHLRDFETLETFNYDHNPHFFHRRIIIGRPSELLAIKDLNLLNKFAWHHPSLNISKHFHIPRIIFKKKKKMGLPSL